MTGLATLFPIIQWILHVCTAGTRMYGTSSLKWIWTATIGSSGFVPLDWQLCARILFPFITTSSTSVFIYNQKACADTVWGQMKWRQFCGKSENWRRSSTYRTLSLVSCNCARHCLSVNHYLCFLQLCINSTTELRSRLEATHDTFR